MEYGVFVPEPESIHTIYHLSANDKWALCGRDISNYVCIGTTNTDDKGLVMGIGGRQIIIKKCCKQCLKTLKGEIKEEKA